MIKKFAITYGALALLAIAIMGGVAWYVATQSSSLTVGSQEYRVFKMIYAGMESELPVSWQLVSDPERDCNPNASRGDYNYSFSPDNIYYDDIAWRQTDVCIVNKSVEATKSQMRLVFGRWGKEYLPSLNKEVDVYFGYPDENGEVSIGGTKGGVYFIPTPSDNNTLVINKQAEADPDYEREFQRFMDNIRKISY